ncbi:uncharacterized protein [Clytia hemisphaerica]|uniref:uncharacterized protein isoform X1 n=1 Tax=Clytia hemisphaerica TaxID=252671 RepID=UPI0034D5A9F2
MFSNLKFRRNGRREREEDEEETSAPPEKMPRVELDEEDEDSSVSLLKELEDYARKYLTKHFSDKSIKEKILTDCPVPSNVDKPPKLDIYIKELVNETFGKAKTLRIDGYMTHIQQSIRSIMGPVSQMWISVANEREALMSSGDTDSEESKTELQRLEIISKTLDAVTALVGQASQRTSYYRRHLILESLFSDHKRAKVMLGDWETTLSENTTKDLFGNKFEEEICRSAKTKSKSKDVFKGMMKAGSSSNQPFQRGPLPTSYRGGRGQSSGGQRGSFQPRFQFSSFRGNYRGNNRGTNFRGRGRGRGSG